MQEKDSPQTRRYSFEEQQYFEAISNLPTLGKPPKYHYNNEQNGGKKNYEPTNWDLFYDQLGYLEDGTSMFRAGQQGALFFCIHGGGHSALSYATLAKEVKNFGTLVAFDFKGHGYSKRTQNLEDFSIETLVTQTIEVLKQAMQRYQQKNVIIVGHSMGGSVACRVVDQLTNKQKQQRIVGCVIIDVVQGTAIEALPFMNQVLSQQPKHFDSIQNAVKWSINANQLKKLQSAKVSIPSQLKEQQQNGKKQYVWKMDLSSTEKYWLGWFKGLSQCFLNIHIPKILVTAEKERLDKELTIAQMQGKFKVVVLHNVGHCVQEDDYRGTARIIHEFMRDFRIPMTKSQVSQKQLVGIANFHPHLNEY